MKPILIIYSENVIFSATVDNNGYYIIENKKKKWFWSYEEAAFYLKSKGIEK